MGATERAIRVLLVDASADFLDTTQHALVSRGFEVEAVTSGTEALAAFGAQGYDAVILDVNLPEVDGYRLFFCIHEFHPQTQIILLSGDEDIRKAIELIKHGFFQSLGKTCDMDQLAETLRRAKTESDRLRAESRQATPLETEFTIASRNHTGSAHR